eukprot:gene31289-40659_t
MSIAKAQVGAESQLVSVLRRFLSLVDDARVLILTTADGTELLTVTKSPDSNGAHDYMSTVLGYCSTLDQPGKLGLGDAKYSVSWLDRGGLVLQSRIEPAPPSASSAASGLVATIVLEQGSNLGLLEAHLQLLGRILRPFSAQTAGR